LTTHLALLSTRLPRLISEGDEDPLFDDDWEASTYLYPFHKNSKDRIDKPPVTLLVISVGENVLFDPSKEELAAAEGALAVSIGQVASTSPDETESRSQMDVDGGEKLNVDSANDSSRKLHVLAMRTIDLPSRLTPLGVPNSLNTATGGTAPVSSLEFLALREGKEDAWTPPRGGIKRSIVAKIVKAVVENGGMGEEVLQALQGFHGD
jgi:exosome complex component RRP42